MITAYINEQGKLRRIVAHDAKVMIDTIVFAMPDGTEREIPVRDVLIIHG